LKSQKRLLLAVSEDPTHRGLKAPWGLGSQLMENPMKNASNNSRLNTLLQLFKNSVFTVDYSPVLTACDVGGASGEEVYINWHDAEGNEHIVVFPFDNLVD